MDKIEQQCLINILIKDNRYADYKKSDLKKFFGYGLIEEFSIQFQCQESLKNTDFHLDWKNTRIHTISNLIKDDNKNQYRELDFTYSIKGKRNFNNEEMKIIEDYWNKNSIKYIIKFKHIDMEENRKQIKKQNDIRELFSKL